MVLKTLEMQGFKSFPDKTVLEFGRGITAIVGPNGSGKSNISDAVRWVLGETSTKSLRGSKMEDVIFGGTSSRKQMGFAQVKLTLDNSDKTLKDKDNIVTVSRRYYRSGDSEYKIDGELVRRRDVHELFMDTGLGADGYSIVSQGKIDSIISAKNEDRREIFEEAAGISRFRHKRTEAERRLASAEENLVRLNDILGELESRVGPLKIQSEKAAKFIKLSDEKKTLEIGTWLNKINKFTNDLREQEHKIALVNEEYAGCEKELHDIETEIETVLENIAGINTKIEAMRQSVTVFEEEALRKDGDVQVLEAQFYHNNETIERLSAEIATANEGEAAVDAQIKEKQQFIADSEKAIESKKSELNSLVLQSEQLLQSNEKYSRETAEVSKEITELTLKLSNSKIKASEAKSSIDEINARFSVVGENISQYENEIEVVKSEKARCEKELNDLKQSIGENENSLNGYKLKLQSKTDKVENLKLQLEKAEKTLSEKQSRAKMLTDLEKNMEGYSGAVKEVMKSAKAKKLSGIHGPVSQLIQVGNEYSVAVEVALGGAMQNIVVESESDAKRAIYHLKDGNFGRATFLPITSIKGRVLDEKGLQDNLGFIAVAADIVECDKKYREIVSNLLSRVVIVDDIDSAIGISRKYKNRFKIVTLDGQVMNAGGSMTGGSRAKGAGILSRANMIEELNAEAEKLKTRVDEINRDYKTANEDANRVMAQMEAVGAEIKTANEDLIRKEGELKLLANKVASYEEQLSALKQEKANSSGRIEALNKVLSESENAASETENEIAKAEEKLASISKNSGEILEKKEAVREKTEAVNIEIVALQRDIEGAKTYCRELDERKLQQKAAVLSTQGEIAEFNAKNDDVKQQIRTAKEKAVQLRNKADDMNGEIKEKISERDGLEKRSNDLRVLERNKSGEREKISSEIVRLDERKIAMRKEYDELNDMLFEQYELTRREAEALGIVIDDMNAAKRRLQEIKSAIKALGSVNVGAVEEYKEVSERYEFLKGQINDVEQSKAELNRIIGDLTVSMSEQFMTQFNKIRAEFKNSFSYFFGGGSGEIVLEDPNNCLECPIEIKIQPPGKSVQNINLFSGGEKSLAALALLFSVLKVAPAPFCIYDEVEAALDEVNVERFARYLRRMTEDIQFIAITHRRGTMEEADVLYGVTMQEKGVSKLLKLNSTELAEKMNLQ